MTPHPLVYWWPVILAGAAIAGWVLRKTVWEPRARVEVVAATVAVNAARVERIALDLAEANTRISEGLDELRVAQARMSDAHADGLHEVSQRVDRVLELLVEKRFQHRRTDERET